MTWFMTMFNLRGETVIRYWNAYINPWRTGSFFSFTQPSPSNSNSPARIYSLSTMISSVFTISFLAALANVVVALGPAAVNLRTAGNYAILAKSGVSTVPPSVITGAVAVSPIAAVALTGFSLKLDSTGQYSTSPQVVGKLYAATYAVPTPATLTAAIGDLGTAFTDATGRVNPNFNNLGSGTISGLVLTPGLYKWSSALLITGDVTISGSPSDTWIFQVSGTMFVAAGKKVVLVGGALAKNIVWVVSGSVTAGPGAHLEGVILGKTSITLQTGATANSRLLAQTHVALQKATVTN
ncbi:antifreeze protein [Hymenopellis radicata]|nr:antifreeze protein [Hymenopellis radicata]